MSKRLGLPELTDSTPPLERMFEAECPAKGSSVHSPIACCRVDLTADLAKGAQALQLAGELMLADAALAVAADGVVCAVVSPQNPLLGSKTQHSSNVAHAGVLAALRGKLPHYAMPERTITVAGAIVRDEDGAVDAEWLQEQLDAESEGDADADEVRAGTAEQFLRALLFSHSVKHQFLRTLLFFARWGRSFLANTFVFRAQSP